MIVVTKMNSIGMPFIIGIAVEILFVATNIIYHLCFLGSQIHMASDWFYNYQFGTRSGEGLLLAEKLPNRVMWISNGLHGQLSKIRE